MATWMYWIWSSSAMMKAPAPITGGMIWPPVDAVASTAAANSGRYRIRFMRGMLKIPSTTTLATADPEIVPKKAEETTDTLAGPPWERPATSLSRSTKVSPPPVWYSTAPNTRKMATSVAEIPVTAPRIPWVERNSDSWIDVQEKPRCPQVPGIHGPRKA